MNLQDRLLVKAAQDGNLIGIQNALRSGANPNREDRDGKTALHYAAQNGFLSLVQYLVMEANANPNHEDRYQKPPVYYAAIHVHTELVQWLLENGANEFFSEQPTEHMVSEGQRSPTLKDVLWCSFRHPSAIQQEPSHKVKLPSKKRRR